MESLSLVIRLHSTFQLQLKFYESWSVDSAEHLLWLDKQQVVHSRVVLKLN